MTDYDLTLTDDAARDLDELYAQVNLQAGATAANRLLDQIQGCFQSLQEDPSSGSPPPELSVLGVHDYLSRPVERYRIVYRVIGPDVHILLIADERRTLHSYLERRLLEP